MNEILINKDILNRLQDQVEFAIDILDGNADPIDWYSGNHPELIRKLCEHLDAKWPNGTVARLMSKNKELLETLEEFYNAEWMVSHDWGGDRDSILNKVADVLIKNGKNVVK
jgi:ribonuclease HI